MPLIAEHLPFGKLPAVRQAGSPYALTYDAL
jgi:hypothetical protein